MPGCLTDHRVVYIDIPHGGVQTQKKRKWGLQRWPILKTTSSKLDRTFEEIRKAVPQEDTKRANHDDWISLRTWRSLHEKALLRWRKQDGARNSHAHYNMVMRRTLCLLQADRNRRMEHTLKQAEALIESDSKRSFQLLASWYKRREGVNLPLAHCEMEELEMEYGKLYQAVPTTGEPLRGPVGTAWEIPDSIPEEEEIRQALKPLRRGKASGPSRVRVDHLKDWMQDYEAGMAMEARMEAIPGPVLEGGLHRMLVVVLVQEVFRMGQVPSMFRQAVLVLIPKQEATKYRGIALLEALYKLCSSVINWRIVWNADWHDGVHGFCRRRGCTMAIIEAKFLAQKAQSEGKLLYQVFLDLTKAYNTVARDCLFLLLEDYGLGPRWRAVLQATWTDSVLVPKKGGRYGQMIFTSRGVRQGDIISPTLFNIIIDAILRFERHQMASRVGNLQFLDVRFYVDDGAIAGTDPAAIQVSLDLIIEAFTKMGVRVN